MNSAGYICGKLQLFDFSREMVCAPFVQLDKMKIDIGFDGARLLNYGFDRNDWRSFFALRIAAKATFKWVPRHAAKSLGETLRVAEIAAARNFAATGNWIPSRISPFDLGRGGHEITIEQNKNTKDNLSEVAKSQVNGTELLDRRSAAGSASLA